MQNLKNIFEKLNIQYTSKKEEQFIGYMEEILEKNEHINLTTITDRDEFIQKHYIDTLHAAGYDEFRNAKTVIDIGTGGGFPGAERGFSPACRGWPGPGGRPESGWDGSRRGSCRGLPGSGVCRGSGDGFRAGGGASGIRSGGLPLPR